ncbi:MAG: LysR family transcriptional regulator, partial [Lachnospira sp.]|nr:LysR family transcriptional regulator [Lachnospira sp.]
STPAEVEAPLKMIKLGSFQEILVGGTTFTALGSQTLSLNELHNYPLIGLGRETMTFQFFNRVFMSHGLEFAPDTETATTDQILPLVKSELGLAFIPEPMAAEAINKNEIVRIQLRDEIPGRNICMVYDSRHPLNSAARELQKVIMEGR